DTALYRDVAFLARNEVGMHPGGVPRGVRAFETAARRRFRSWPAAMLATATHDTKRGEDARARLAVLSEIADEWQRTLVRWSQMNSGSASVIEGVPAPDVGEEWLLYQSLVSIWPAKGSAEDAGVADRIVAYLRKAMREAK